MTATPDDDGPDRPGLDAPAPLTETPPVERAARRAIARAKRRGEETVTPDDLLAGALAEAGRFGVAWIGERAIDVRALTDGGRAVDGAPAADGEAPEDAEPATVYAEEVVELFERAAALAREDGAASMGLVHLLAAVPEVECGLLAELCDRYGFTDAEWRGELARGRLGAPPRLAGRPGDGTPAPGDGSPAARDIFTVDEAADYLNVHSQTVRNYIRSGKLLAYRLAGERHIRVLRQDLLALLERVRTNEANDDEENS